KDFMWESEVMWQGDRLRTCSALWHMRFSHRNCAGGFRMILWTLLQRKRYFTWRQRAEESSSAGSAVLNRGMNSMQWFWMTADWLIRSRWISGAGWRG